MRIRILGTLVLAVGVLLAGCDGSNSPADDTDSGGLVAHVASYDVSTAGDQRMLVGLEREGRPVSFGTVQFAFTYLGDTNTTVSTPGPEATATWLPIPGQDLTSPLPTEPQVIASSDEGVGVYAGYTQFDKPGFWEVRARVELDGGAQTATATFPVGAEPAVVAVGDAAPRSTNLVAGDQPLTAVDSRAGHGALPDLALHQQTVADAIATGRPSMVVVSTPVYCTSRFCGPITNEVLRLARRHGSEMNFIHLEVWKDFQEKTLNDAAAEWAQPSDRGEVQEPWVFVVDGDGIVTHRFDNVASDQELATAVEQSLAR